MNNHHVPLLIEESAPGRRCWHTSGAELDVTHAGGFDLFGHMAILAQPFGQFNEDGG